LNSQSKPSVQTSSQLAGDTVNEQKVLGMKVPKGEEQGQTLEGLLGPKPVN
jgi:hypothetical protein